MTTIIANLSKMFDSTEPWLVSNSEANLGPNAARYTWSNASSIAARASKWLISDLSDAAECMRDWARETGAWDDTEIAQWSDEYALGLFVQNVASELRECLDVDNQSLADCVAQYASTSWEGRSVFPIGHYEMLGADAVVHYYTGV